MNERLILCLEFLNSVSKDRNSLLYLKIKKKNTAWYVRYYREGKTDLAKTDLEMYKELENKCATVTFLLLFSENLKNLQNVQEPFFIIILRQFCQLFSQCKNWENKVKVRFCCKYLFKSFFSFSILNFILYFFSEKF